MSDAHDIVNPAWPRPRALLVASMLLLLSGITSLAGNILIYTRFPDRPAPQDLLLQVLPSSTYAQYVTEVAIIGVFVVLLIYVLRHARHQLADMIAIFGIFYLIRSVLMVLTPLAHSYAGPGNFGAMPLDQLGMFPSGHAGASLICFMMIDADRAPVLRRLTLAFAVTQWVALLLSHGHYSIDVAGGMLLAYFVYREWDDGPLFRPLRRLVHGEERPAVTGAEAA